MKKKLITRDNIYEHLLEKQFTLVERTIIDAVFNKNWMDEWFITQEQRDQFEKYSIALIKKTLKCSSKKAKIAFNTFIELHGLTIKN